MFLADYHTHSTFSFDGKDCMADMLVAAQAAGLDELCVTDHCDMGRQEFPAKERYEAFWEARAANKTGVKLLLGIELGEAIHDIERAEASVAACPYDFIIGSHHALRGERDFYHIRGTTEEEFHLLLIRYFDELLEFAEWGRFDVLGHIDYPLRYCGHTINLLPRYETELRALFTLMASKGLGMEMNMSKGVMPDPALFALYRQCGGEIITIGSDAHSAAAVGGHIADGIEMCRRAGFGAVAAFERRKVRYEKI
ncbi:MAG: PHP domain-containing protein [Oscillospiraceae bacterium]|jgi:histidinol-phosphatase (PHP family)|nr:PHP domain-containing protein [Oscillospiraceae bacterium]